MATRSPPSLAARPAGKPGFAKRAGRFAKRAARLPTLPGFPMLWIGCLGAGALLAITGAFGTATLPPLPRAAFWLMLMTLSAAKWQLWFAFTVRGPQDWLRAALLGVPLLLLPLPAEIALCGRAVGIDEAPDAIGTWLRAAALSVVVYAVAFTAVWWLKRQRAARPAVAAAGPQDGLLARARIAPDALAAIHAEDHYCRVRARDGRSALVHYRFGDAVAEVAGLQGTQVHRGAWVADAAVAGAERDGRRWRLRLADGTLVPVSASRAAEARRRHWLRPPPRPGG